MSSNVILLMENILLVDMANLYESTISARAPGILYRYIFNRTGGKNLIHLPSRADSQILHQVLEAKQILFENQNVRWCENMHQS